mgnify:CR=1 FL=1
MDNVTHTLVGAALAETGLKRWTPLATPTLLIAANFPDIDIVVGLFGSLAYLEHHRGITHAMVGIPLLSLLLAGLMYAVGARWQRRHPEQERARFGPLLGLSLLAMSTHPLLDFTNSYGWRPSLPWDRTWVYGDIDFVMDPWIWAVVGGAVMWVTASTKKRVVNWIALFVVLAAPVIFIPTMAWMNKVVWLGTVALIFGLRAYSQLSAVMAQWLMRGVVLALLLYFGALWGLHQRALQELRATAPRYLPASEQLQQVAAMPSPGNPLLQRAIVSTSQAYYLFDFHLLALQLAPPLQAIPRTSGDATAIAVAQRESEFQTFLRFARFPVITAQRHEDQTTLVEVHDARFDPDTRRVSSFQVSIRLDALMRRIVE